MRCNGRTELNILLKEGISHDLGLQIIVSPSNNDTLQYFLHPQYSVPLLLLMVPFYFPLSQYNPNIYPIKPIIVVSIFFSIIPS